MPLPDAADQSNYIHRVSVVIPVFSGETTLDGLVDEIVPFTEVTVTPGLNRWTIAEVVLVFDHGSDGSAETIRRLKAQFDFVRVLWLSRNFGQHTATIAGMAATTFEWISTIDEDGQHDPADIALLIDSALINSAPLVYARPMNEAPHGVFRNTASTSAKFIVSKLSGNPAMSEYQSFRLILGEIGRGAASYAGSGVYLDVALGWVASKTAAADIELRHLSDRESGYSTLKLLSHFWRLILSSGVRGLRVVSAMGAFLAFAGVLLALAFVVQKLAGWNLPAGWTSQITVLLVASGAILFSLGVIAEYIGVLVNKALGKPAYLVVSDPMTGPLGQDHRSQN